MKKIISMILILALTLGFFSGCGTQLKDVNEEKGEKSETEETVIFTDSAGRTVEIPGKITRIAPSGAVATMILATIAPEYMVSVSSALSEQQCKYLPECLSVLPSTGQMYGSKSTLNLETLLECDAQIVIDLGDKKNGIAEDLDELQAQIGIPVVFIEADLSHMEAMFRTLGSILYGKEEKGNELADFAAETVAMAAENSAKIQDGEKISVMYTSGTSGLDTNAYGSTQAQVIELIGAKNAIVVEDVSNKGGGNTINLEQLYGFDPDVIIFATGSIYELAADDNSWNKLSAVAEGRYYEIPGIPYNWMSNPPSLNMLLGVWWLGNLLYPQYYDYDMPEKAQEIFSLMWDYELSDAEAEELLMNSTLKVIQ